MQAVILVAGKSTRTYPLTLTRPKPLLPVANKTIIEHILEQLEGLVEEVVLIVGYRKEMIEKYIDKNILVVSHAYAIRCLIASCVLGDKYTDKAMLRTVHAVRISKASLSILEYLPENKYFYVSLLNDTTHLDDK